MIKSITANSKDGTVDYEYCKMHDKYPNDCRECPYLTPYGDCREWEVSNDEK